MKAIYQYIKNTAIIYCAIVLLTGCKKLIEIDPPVNTISTAQAFSTDAEVDAVMEGLYSQMVNSGIMTYSTGGSSLLGALSADEAVNYSGVLDQVYYPVLTNSLTTLNDKVTQPTIWTAAYKDIYNANGIIENLALPIANGVSDTLKHSCTGEAKFVRAFAYFYLTNFYGDVPLALTTNFNTNALLKRSPQQTAYNQIVQDLKDAQSLLPDNFNAGKGERIRPNKAAATAMLARTYLYLKDWKDAEAQATLVINNNQFSLLPVLDSVFSKNSQESIWQLKQNEADGVPGVATFDGINFSTYYLWQDLSPDDQAAYLDPGFYPEVTAYFVPKNYLTDDLNNAFEPGDKRHVAWVRSTPSPTAAPYNGIVYNYPFKYTAALASNTTNIVSQYYVMLRLAEQYLIRAEARAEQGELNGAVSDINLIRARAGLANTTASGQAAILDAIAQERRIELFAEFGHRWLDLKRTGKASNVLGAIPIKQPWNPDHLLYPIPIQEIIRDPGLVQNPGY